MLLSVFSIQAGARRSARASGRFGPVAIAATRRKSADAKRYSRPGCPIAHQISPRGEILNPPYSTVNRPCRPISYKRFAAVGRGFLIALPKIEPVLDGVRAGRCARLDPP